LKNKPIEIKIHPLILNDSYIHFNVDDDKEENVDDKNELILTLMIESIPSCQLNVDCLANNDTLTYYFIVIQLYVCI
jgi:hypothetical protein